MGSDSDYRIRELKEEDVPKVVDLFNRNKVYQFKNGELLTAEDFHLTKSIKEITHFYILEKNNKIVGTTAFFKFITFGALPEPETYSGFLLIDSEYRTGTAISLLHKEVLLEIINSGFHTHYTEISKYNRASLNLSKRNGFSKFEDSYEDIYHCYLLRSSLPKVLKAFKFTGDLSNKYDINTFRIIEEKSNKNITTFLTEISKEKMNYRCFSKAKYPFDIKLELFRLYIFKENDKYYLQCDFYSENMYFVKAKINNLKYTKLTRKRNKKEIKNITGDIFVQSEVFADIGKIKIQLHYKEQNDLKKPIKLNKKVFSYKLMVNPDNGSLYITNNSGEVILEDTFLQFSLPQDVIFLVDEYKNRININCIGENINIQKIVELSPNNINNKYQFIEIPKRDYGKFVKFGLRFWKQDYLILEGNHYVPYVPGYFPNEQDDFLRAEEFKKKKFCYIINSEQLKLTYNCSSNSSNQMQYRPLSYMELTSIEDMQLNYSIHLERLSIHDDILCLNELEIIEVNWKNFREFSAHTAMQMNSVKHHITQVRSPLFYQINKTKGEIYIGDNKATQYRYKELEFSWACSGRVQAWKYDNFYMYENKGPVWEMMNNLLVYDVSKHVYFLISVEEGSIYSFKENNRMVIRCVIPNKSNIKDCVKIKQLVKKEKNDE
ncbi:MULTISPECIES: GNAT family N-acetyltransferase [Lactococcus]|jgi:CylE protein|uniref:GNAT family N-acetyltransferase n=4 Tax=Lactococcus TaxID=1357 RepID=A0A9Q9D6L3_9LACT|nr:MULTISPECIES: GNAT family N-acetyltransferase [Lactococcus]USI65611.1 GNAT family N-acetyltransferase [Lactococcus petauri]USI68073.1 GNAT family N-acetyltransferase [Lactococcus petauri]USJ20333.1 GNAT family N-acetyltransferase [Lactococcus formosensis]WJE12733.1 GNAT family N-acetyltransferase [Lactococcus petauri]